jgi:hypothetical protein
MSFGSVDMPALPRTTAVRLALTDCRDPGSAADLLYLEAWEYDPAPGTAAALRIAQIRRANPELAAAVREEVAQERRPGAAAAASR